MTLARRTLSNGLYTVIVTTSTSHTTIGLAVTEAGEITVTGPLDLTDESVRIFVGHKEAWIGARLQHLVDAAADAQSAGGPCPSCYVPVGSLHTDYCSLARCAFTGLQRSGCDHPTDRCRTRWTGRLPGETECQEYGFYARLGSNGWESCAADHPDAMPDFNRLYAECWWDVRAQRMRLPAI
ncbi:hypothetical protein ACWCQZ_42710 [Streptomyces sp. NPDC002285]